MSLLGLVAGVCSILILQSDFSRNFALARTGLKILEKVVLGPAMFKHTSCRLAVLVGYWLVVHLVTVLIGELVVNV